MDRDEALRLLRGGPEGIAEWNRRRPAGLDLINLSASGLRRAFLFEADLSGATLQGSDLVRANLQGANLRGVDLRKANLQRANLRGAVLSGCNAGLADFREADLRGTNLSNADLSGADMTEAFMGLTSVGCKLFAARGLDSVVHLLPSQVSIESILSLDGVIPEAFLRGCGVLQEEIAYFRSRTKRTEQFYSCFISYSSADRLFARRLHDALQGKGVRCWLDEHQILPGDDIYDQVDSGINLWDKTLLCCSRNSLERSWWVHKELERAFAKEQRLQKERGSKTLALIPLNLDGFLFEWEDGKAETVKARHAQDFTGWDKDPAKFEKALERTVRALRTDAGGREEPPSPKL